MITGKSIGTLVVFIISLIFVIHPVYIPVTLPYFGRRKIPINLTTAPIAAIAILWAAQCINPAVIRSGIVGTEGVKPYNILILFFSLAYMAITLDVTGVLRSAAYWVSNKGGADGWKLYFYFYVMLTLLSVLVGNDPVILSGTAFLVYYTQVVEELQPLPWLITEFAAANTASLVLFVGNPTNVVIFQRFGVNNAAFTAYMILPFLACSVACFMALAVQYRSSKHDDWMIGLPFAVVKLLFDLTWDNYKWVKKNRMHGPHGRGQSDTNKDIPSETQISSSPIIISDILPTITSKGQRQETLSTRETLVNVHVTHDPYPIVRHSPAIATQDRNRQPFERKDGDGKSTTQSATKDEVAKRRRLQMRVEGKFPSQRNLQSDYLRMY
jgi:Citrate transporter